MRIRVLFFEGCPSYKSAVATIREVVAERNLEAEIELVRISSKEQAIAQRFLGSPTVQINGVDLEGPTTRGADLCCRIYNEGGSLRGWPSREMIRAALLEKRNEACVPASQPRCCAPSSGTG